PNRKSKITQNPARDCQERLSIDTVGNFEPRMKQPCLTKGSWGGNKCVIKNTSWYYSIRAGSEDLISI
ncbi:MAG TPA: hypothetical protein DEA79_22215, partial [Cyanobacteria bacterium UBA11153]|nr:hypothetical protein [Cyanobacteria bacterium UBA11153]